MHGRNVHIGSSRRFQKGVQNGLGQPRQISYGIKSVTIRAGENEQVARIWKLDPRGRVHRRVANVRNDWQWKQARLLVIAFDLLVFETLNIKAMHQLWGTKVGDLGFAEFLLKTQWIGHQAGQRAGQD
jgi:hypothetical protein